MVLDLLPTYIVNRYEETTCEPKHRGYDRGELEGHLRDGQDESHQEGSPGEVEDHIDHHHSEEDEEIVLGVVD